LNAGLAVQSSNFIDRKPLAAAPVAQVQAARLFDGSEVIVKVRRIGVKRMIDRDMQALAAATRVVVAVAPRPHRYQLLRLIDEVWDGLRRETDFRKRRATYGLSPLLSPIGTPFTSRG
jgi:ubiquinone biosynthesis protein